MYYVDVTDLIVDGHVSRYFQGCFMHYVLMMASSHSYVSHTYLPFT